MKWWLYAFYDLASLVIWYYNTSIMPEKYLIGKNKVDICKIIDYVMIIRNSLDLITMKYPDSSKNFVQIKTATNNIEELICKVIEK